MINEIKNRNELADLLGIQRQRLTYLLYVKGLDNMYTSFSIPKKNGDSRIINAPNKELKYIQSKLAEELYLYRKKLMEEKELIGGVSQAFEKGKNIFTNALVHRNKRYVINMDLENFFDSFHFGRVRGFFLKSREFELPNEVATVLAKIVCCDGKLPQGAPTSPIISNMICNIFDIRIIKLAKKYRLDYTRYADDLTFSTNDKNYLMNKEQFYIEIKKEIEKAGFHINEDKTRISYNSSRQEVTGIITNKKINIKREYYKKTRAMAHCLYKTGEYKIDSENGIAGTINQLEGRFAFINQADKFDNIHFGDKRSFYKLNGREKEYKKFLFYKYFFANDKPLVVTEGKTDVLYIKSALKKLYKDYPELITKDDKGVFKYYISFLKKSNRLAYFLNIQIDGADSIGNIYSYYTDKDDINYPSYMNKFQELQGKNPDNPVIMLFDNELNDKKRPIAKFCKNNVDDSQIEQLKISGYSLLSSNLYLMTTPLVKRNGISDIEDLFEKEILDIELDGKKFCKADRYDIHKFYGKDRFSKYIVNNYKDINFDNFRPLLDNLLKIKKEYNDYRTRSSRKD